MNIHKMKVNIKAKIITITGRVQGVGFRPFIYNLAIKFNLKGYVKNNEVGVYIFVEGEDSFLNSFIDEIDKQPPPLAEIIGITINDVIPLYKGQFEIVQNAIETSTSKMAIISPDFAICDKCKIDIVTKHHWFYNYFATTCTDCGPRYSIVQTVPYDRENTSMSKFKMCSYCQEEYENPLNRRYHAQPISCHNCGPQLNSSIQDIAQRIKEGYIVAIKGIGGFHIVCDATNGDTLKQLRKYKNRPTKPFAIMFKNLEELKISANISKNEEKILISKEAPIVILKKAKAYNLSKYIAPSIDRIGCFLPYTPLQILLLKYLDNPIVATSANLGNEPIIQDIEEIKLKLPFIKNILDFDRDIVNAVDDSLVQVVDEKIQLLRLARGYAPFHIKLPKKISKKILAVGANQKNTIALAFEDNLIISPYIGDLNSLKSFDFFKRTLETFKNFYDFEPDIIVHDKHPNYETTKWAKQQKKELFPVQHHLAHIYACKAEFCLSGEYLGFSFDGTGYGDDGLLWGGEIFVGDKRKYNFKPIKLLGGERAIKEPRRVALSLLFDRYPLDDVLSFKLPFTKNEINLLYKSYTKNLNAPLSTSVGRLFDGIASLAGICDFQTYEGEAGLLCEMAYKPKCKSHFQFDIKNNQIEIDFDYFDKDIVTKFINTLVEIVIFIALEEKLEVILSGGVFQNKILLELIIKKLKKQNILFYYQRNTPINDGGISLGQIWKYIENISMYNYKSF